ncbi:MAG: hypothetical protein ABIQ13_01825 [Pedococcus sp.]
MTTARIRRTATAAEESKYDYCYCHCYYYGVLAYDRVVAVAGVLMTASSADALNPLWRGRGARLPEDARSQTDPSVG